MSTEITDNEMSSDVTRHTAQRVVGGWAASWLPGAVLTRDQAITAMTIAEMVAERPAEAADSASQLRLFIDGWAEELGLTGPEAVAAVAR